VAERLVKQVERTEDAKKLETAGSWFIKKEVEETAMDVDKDGKRKRAEDDDDEPEVVEDDHAKVTTKRPRLGLDEETQDEEMEDVIPNGQKELEEALRAKARRALEEVQKADEERRRREEEAKKAQQEAEDRELLEKEAKRKGGTDLPVTQDEEDENDDEDVVEPPANDDEDGEVEVVEPPVKGKGKDEVVEPLANDDEDGEDEAPVKGKPKKKEGPKQKGKGKGKDEVVEPPANDDEDGEDEAPVKGKPKKKGKGKGKEKEKDSENETETELPAKGKQKQKGGVTEQGRQKSNVKIDIPAEWSALLRRDRFKAKPAYVFPKVGHSSTFSSSINTHSGTQREPSKCKESDFFGPDSGTKMTPLFFVSG
jgi:nucleolar protein involved in exit from mitosis